MTSSVPVPANADIDEEVGRLATLLKQVRPPPQLRVSHCESAQSTRLSQSLSRLSVHTSVAGSTCIRQLPKPRPPSLLTPHVCAPKRQMP